VSLRRQFTTTRAVRTGGILLALFLVVAALYAARWPTSGTLGVGASISADPSVPAAAPTAPEQTASSSGSSSSVALPTASLMASPAPPAFKPTPRPTPQEFRIYHVPVLMYHRIVPRSESAGSISGLVVPPETFSAQMKALFDAGWHSITMATLADEMETDTTIPPKTFVITFDDGWYDGYVYAFPIMRKYGFVGTCYVITGRIDSADFLSTQELRTLEAAGNDIGNHTVNHTSLPTVSMARATQEVENASEAIARAVGHRPVSLAYPMGGITTTTAFVVSQIPDIKLAVTESSGNSETWFGRLAMPRVRVLPSTDPARLLLYMTSP
jgi:peptidoglycan/xylan/chitin deacetylase (PgdA/CDA1 family)